MLEGIFIKDIFSYLSSTVELDINENAQFHQTTRYGGIKVGGKKIQRNIGHFLVLVECISIALGHERKKITVQFFNK